LPSRQLKLSEKATEFHCKDREHQIANPFLLLFLAVSGEFRLLFVDTAIEETDRIWTSVA
jgi:hypothetical protein